MQSTVTSSVYNFWPIVSGNKKAALENTEFSMFGIHFIPTIAITNSLPYLLFPSAKTTLFIQVLAISISAILIFLFLNLNQINFFLSAGVAIAYLLHPATIGALANAYHPVLMAPVFLVAMLICYKLKLWKTYILMAILACGVQENVILSVLAMSVLFLFEKRYKAFLFHFLITSIIFVSVTKFIIPYYNPDGALPYGSAYGSPLGNSMSEIVINGLTTPLLLLKTFFTPEKTIWMLTLLAPFCLLSLLSPVYLFIAFIGIGPNLVSNNKAMLLMWGQYNALAMPFLALAAGLGLKNIIEQLKKIKIQKLSLTKLNLTSAFFGFIFVLGSIYAWKKSAQTITTIDPSRVLTWNRSDDFYSPRYLQYKAVADRVDKNSCLSSPEEFLGHLHQRELSFIFPVHYNKCDQFIVLKKHPYIPQEKMDFFISEAISSGYKINYENELFQLFKK